MESYHLFEVYGVELEYMLVDAETLEVRPIADQLLARLAGEITSDVERGAVTWSNELAAHVVELKTTEPVRSLHDLPQVFSAAIEELRLPLSELGLSLLPSAMHPWMDPRRETSLWPHENANIYQTFHRIFDCHRHGWANVQSVHLNLPFADDQEFARLHAAVRLILPLLPAVAASSPIVDGCVGQQLDSRLIHYIGHCDRVPSLTGPVIPEPIYDRVNYRKQIFGPIAVDIAPLDPEQVMQVEFLNARGAIARFDRGSIEIRLMDVQEYPQADVAICAAVAGVLKLLIAETWSTQQQQAAVTCESLRALLDDVVRDADRAILSDPEYLRHFGIEAPSVRAGELWQVLLEQLQATAPLPASQQAPLGLILDQGPLARRLLHAIGDPPTGSPVDRSQLHQLYRQLAGCLQQGQPFVP